MLMFLKKTPQTMIVLVIQSHIVKILRLTCCMIHDGEGNGTPPQSSWVLYDFPWDSVCAALSVHFVHAGALPDSSS